MSCLLLLTKPVLAGFTRYEPSHNKEFSMPPEFRFGYPLEEGTPYPEDRDWGRN